MPLEQSSGYHHNQAFEYHLNTNHQDHRSIPAQDPALNLGLDDELVLLRHSIGDLYKKLDAVLVQLHNQQEQNHKLNQLLEYHRKTLEYQSSLISDYFKFEFGGQGKVYPRAKYNGPGDGGALQSGEAAMMLANYPPGQPPQPPPVHLARGLSDQAQDNLSSMALAGPFPVISGPPLQPQQPPQRQPHHISRSSTIYRQPQQFQPLVDHLAPGDSNGSATVTANNSAKDESTPASTALDTHLSQLPEQRRFSTGSDGSSADTLASRAVNPKMHKRQPIYNLRKSSDSVEHVVKEYLHGVNGGPSIRELEQQHGAKWRGGAHHPVSKKYGRMKPIYDATEKGIQLKLSLEEIVSKLENARMYRRDGALARKSLTWLQNNIPEELR